MRIHHLVFLLAARLLPGGCPGGNDFYVIDVGNYETTNPLEAEAGSGQNDSPATAEAATFSSGSAYLGGYLPTAADVDFWQFSATAGQVLALACGARRNGSGLVDATFTVQASDGTVLQSATENADADVLWSDSPYADASMDALQIADSGDYYLMVSTAGTDPVVSDRSYLCGIHDTTP